ncbi:MAG: ABC transporter permease subunit [Atopobiaceae bacterium]|nr:ABC transporter permease subunit [Atopobiaceae bacterium]
MSPKRPTSPASGIVERLWPVLVWVAVWALAAHLLGQPVLLPSPLEALGRLSELVMAGEFWSSIARSLGRIVLGFVLACTLGVLLAALAYACDSVRRLLAPVVGAVKAAPVASFIILVLVWVSSRDLSLVISFLMGFPIMYTNVLEALRATDAGMLEMADVFRLSVADRIRSIYLSQALPSFEAACSLALGFCWKAGIAAEVIGLPDHTIGDHLHDAKIYLDTPSLFAWTLAIIVLSLIIEKAVRAFISRAVAHVEAHA